MQKKNIVIMITGEEAAGKSHIAALVRKELQKIGMEVDFIVNDDFANSENVFNSIINIENEFAVNKIANTTKTTIIEGSPLWIKKSVDDKLTYKQPRYYKKVSSWAHLYNVNDWAEISKDGHLKPENGKAFWVQDNLRSDIDAFKDTVDDATHVAFLPNTKSTSVR